MQKWRKIRDICLLRFKEIYSLVVIARIFDVLSANKRNHCFYFCASLKTFSLSSKFTETIKKHNRRQRSRNTTGDRYISEPPREQLQIGPLGKQFHSGTSRIETHQSQPTIVIHVVTHSHSTSSPDED